MLDVLKCISFHQLLDLDLFHIDIFIQVVLKLKNTFLKVGENVWCGVYYRYQVESPFALEPQKCLLR